MQPMGPPKNRFLNYYFNNVYLVRHHMVTAFEVYCFDVSMCRIKNIFGFIFISDLVVICARQDSFWAPFSENSWSPFQTEY